MPDKGDCVADAAGKSDIHLPDIHAEWNGRGEIDFRLWLPDPAMEARRQRVLAMLAERPGINYAVLVDNPDSDPVILALAIRGRATCELQIPRAKYDPWLLLDLIERSEIRMLEAGHGGLTR